MLSKQIRIKSYSPSAGKVVKLKLENADASITHEVDMMTTAVNAWEQITFDFVDAPSAQYNRVVIFYDFGNPGDDSVYYFDESVKQDYGYAILTNFKTPKLSFGDLSQTKFFLKALIYFIIYLPYKMKILPNHF